MQMLGIANFSAAKGTTRSLQTNYGILRLVSHTLEHSGPNTTKSSIQWYMIIVPSVIILHSSISATALIALDVD